ASVSGSNSPRWIPSLIAHNRNARVVLTESVPGRRSSGWRCDSNVAVIKNAAAVGFSMSESIVPSMNADTWRVNVVSPRARCLPIQDAFVCEVVIDRRPGQVGPDRDGLEGSGVIAAFAEHLARSTQN